MVCGERLFFVFVDISSGANPGFQVRKGALNFFWDISYEKSRFYAKKSYFFQF